MTIIKDVIIDYDVQTTGLYYVEKEAKAYIKWIADLIMPYLGSRILEIGSGIGSYSDFFLNSDLYCATDIHEDYINFLKRKFVGKTNVKVFKYDVNQDNPEDLYNLKIDTIVCISVLEHIQDDLLALQNMHSLLVPRGNLILFTPCIKFLYGADDAAVGHYRRYSKEELIEKIKSSNFSIDRIFYHNFAGIPVWLLNSKILKKQVIPKSQLNFSNKMIPLLRCIEGYITPPLGLNLICIAKK